MSEVSSPLKVRSVLTIAGSDSGGGAGIQADLKTFAAHGVHGLSAIAALTAQHTRGVTAVHVPPGDFLEAQLEACFADFRVEVVKLGMLADAGVIERVASVLARHRPPAVVVDPVMVATSGARLLDPSALSAMRELLLPLADVVTPNIPEAELLLDRAIQTPADADASVEGLLSLGARSVLLKGGHLETGDEVVDRFGEQDRRVTFTHSRLQVDGHGTGCTLASAIAASICRGHSPEEACRLSTDYVHGALVHAYRPGRSEVCVLHHLWRVLPPLDVS